MKTLCIDIGNVICHVNFDPFLNLLSRQFNVSRADVYHFLERFQRHLDMGTSTIRDELCHNFSIHSEPLLEEVVRQWNNVIQPNSTVISWLLDLLYPKDKSEPCRIALLSNIGTEHAELVRQLIPSHIINQTVHFFSCEVGARKPTLLYFKTFLEVYPEFKNAVYLDDRQENVAAGNRFGLRGVDFALDTFKNEREISDKLSQLLLA